MLQMLEPDGGACVHTASCARVSSPTLLQLPSLATARLPPPRPLVFTLFTVHPPPTNFISCISRINRINCIDCTDPLHQSKTPRQQPQQPLPSSLVIAAELGKRQHRIRAQQTDPRRIDMHCIRHTFECLLVPAQPYQAHEMNRPHRGI